MKKILFFFLTSFILTSTLSCIIPYSISDKKISIDEIKIDNYDKLKIAREWALPCDYNESTQASIFPNDQANYVIPRDLVNQYTLPTSGLSGNTYFLNDSNLHAVNSETGNELWSYALHTYYAQGIEVNGVFYIYYKVIGSSSAEYQLIALSSSDGKLLNKTAKSEIRSNAVLNFKANRIVLLNISGFSFYEPDNLKFISKMDFTPGTQIITEFQIHSPFILCSIINVNTKSLDTYLFSIFNPSKILWYARGIGIYADEDNVYLLNYSSHYLNIRNATNSTIQTAYKLSNPLVGFHSASKENVIYCKKSNLLKDDNQPIVSAKPSSSEKKSAIEVGYELISYDLKRKKTLWHFVYAKKGEHTYTREEGNYIFILKSPIYVGVDDWAFYSIEAFSKFSGKPQFKISIPTGILSFSLFKNHLLIKSRNGQIFSFHIK